MDLPLDVKFKIASFDMDAWIKLSYMDDKFKKFSYSIGRKLFIELFTIIDKNKYCKKWSIFGNLHSFDDQPAVIYSNGDKYWFQNGQLHRDDPSGQQPAVILADGEQRWYKNGQLHRDSPSGQQPAIIDANGGREWFQNGLFLIR